MEFGVPRRREVSQNKEKYENIAVITALPFKGKGTGRILSLNKKAVEFLGLNFDAKDAAGIDIEAQVSFSFDKMHNTVSIANTTGLKNVAEVKVAKTSKSLSDKKYFEAIKENFGVGLEDELELKLVYKDQDFNGFKTFQLDKLEATDVLAATVEEAVAETEVEVAPEAVVEAPEVTPELTLDDINVVATPVEEAPLEYIQEEAEKRDVFESIAESTEEVVSVESSNEEDQDNPFLNLGE